MRGIYDQMIVKNELLRPVNETFKYRIMYAEIEIECDNIIEKLSYKFGDKLKTDITEIMVDCGFNDVCELVETAKGENQNEEYGVIEEVCVDQWSVGDSGDSYQGNIYCKLPDGKWLKLPFWM